MGDFQNILPEEIKTSAVRSGEELVLTYKYAHLAVEIATEHRIAVLGVEVFQILDNGLRVDTYSGYAFDLHLWRGFVEDNNRGATEFLSHNERGDGYGYILNTTSEREFRNLSFPLTR